MSLVTEDGTGLATAESYQSVAGADLYFSNRGNATWAALSTAAKEQNLRRSTDYMLAVYRPRWSGYRTTTTQALDWPRYSVPMRDAPSAVGGTWAAYYPNNTVPTAVANACAELALRANSGDLIPDLSQAIKSEKIGQMETVYQDYSAATKTYRAIDNLLTPLLAGQGGIRVMRA